MKRKRKLSILLTLPMLIGTVSAPLNVWAQDETVKDENDSDATKIINVPFTETLCRKINRKDTDP